MMRGYHTQEELAASLKVHRGTVARDLIVIRKQLKKELDKQKFEDILRDFLMQIQGTYEEAWRTYAKATSPIKVRALRLIHDIQANKIKVLQSLGVVRELAPALREPFEVRLKYEHPYTKKRKKRKKAKKAKK